MARKRIFTDRRRSREAYLGGRKRSLTYTEPEKRSSTYDKPEKRSSSDAAGGRTYDRPRRAVREKPEPNAGERQPVTPATGDRARPSGGRRRPAAGTRLEQPEPAASRDRAARPRVRRPASRKKNVRLALVLITALAIVFLLWFFIGVYPSPIGKLSPEPQSVVNAREVKVAAAFKKGVEQGAFTLYVAGKDMTSKTDLTGSGISCKVELPDGTHQAKVTVNGGGLMGKRTRSWSFTVDGEPPELTLSSKKVTAIKGSKDVQVKFAGKASKGAVVKAGGKEVQTDAAGSFEGTARTSRARSLEITASDRAGNVARTSIITQNPTAAKAIHVSVYIASSDSDLGRMIDLVERTELNALQVDLKDEAGQIAFDLDYPLAKEVGATTNYMKLDSVVDKIRYRDIYTICRIVVMKDPKLAKGRPDLTVHDAAGGPWGKGFWLDPYSKEVWDYNIAAAEAAARAGFQEIQFDYIRFPSDGNTSTCVYPGQDKRTQRDVINGFLEYAREKLAPYNVFISADLFGLTASKQGEMGIGQSVRDVAERVDYISPMVYPSHYNPGEYNIKVPEANPYDIVLNSLGEFEKEMKGTQAKLRPWLQDFSLKIAYTPDMVRRQIDACTEAGVNQWLLWDPDCSYSEEALKPAPK